MSPTQRSLQYLRKSGYVCQVVEHWVAMRGAGQRPGAGIRRDLFGFIDILALLDGQVLAVQCTAKSGVSARLRKITGRQRLPDDPEERAKAEEAAAWFERCVRECLKAGWTIAVHGWEKGDRQPRIEYVTEADLSQ